MVMALWSYPTLPFTSNKFGSRKTQKIQNNVKNEGFLSNISFFFFYFFFERKSEQLSKHTLLLSPFFWAAAAEAEAEAESNGLLPIPLSLYPALYSILVWREKVEWNEWDIGLWNSCECFSLLFFLLLFVWDFLRNSVCVEKTEPRGWIPQIIGI